MSILNIPKSTRASHLDFTAPCQEGGPVTSAKLARFLDIATPTDTEPKNLCGNNCGNPQHWAFLRDGEKRSILENVKRLRVLALFNSEEYKHASINHIATMAGVSRTLVRNVIRDNGIVRADKIQGSDGRQYRATYKKEAQS